jgi:ribokinase
MGRIVVVGSSNTDMVVKAPRLPGPGETVTNGTFFRARGGKGANQAVAAARAGGDVTFIAALGRDELGDDAVAAFAAEGIDTAYVKRTAEAASGVALIVVDAAAENAIAVAEGANAMLSADHVRACEVAIASADVLVAQLEIPLETVAEAVRLAHRHGITVILNPAPARPLPADLLHRVSVLTPNASEAALLAGGVRDIEASASALLAGGVGAVVVTLGRDGVLVAAGGGRDRIKGFNVVAEDTTGAGDVFNGALAVAIAERRPLGEAARFANAAAAISVTRRGAQPSAPARQEIVALLEGGPRG